MFRYLRSIVFDPNARILWFGRSSAYFGDQLHEIAFVWMVWDLTGSSTFTGMAAFVGKLPYWLLGWLTGIYVDRLARRTSLLIASITGAGATVALLVAYEVEALSVWLLMTIAFVMATARSSELLAFGAQLPELVGRSSYQDLVAVMDITKRIARVIGPLLATALEGLLVVAHYYFLVLIAYAITGFFATRFKVERVLHNRHRAGLRGEFAEAIRTVRKKRVLLLVNQCFALYCMTYSAGLFVLMPRLVGVDFHGDVGGYSLLIAAFGGGGLVGNLIFGQRKFRDNGRAVFVGIIIVSAGFTMMAVAPNMLVATVAVFVGAIGLPLMDMTMLALVNQVSPPEQHGRVLSIHRYFAEIGQAAGLLISGPLADWLGARPTLLLFGFWGTR